MVSKDELALLKNVFELEELAIQRMPNPAALFISYGAVSRVACNSSSSECVFVTCCLPVCRLSRRTRKASTPIWLRGAAMPCVRALPSTATSHVLTCRPLS